MVSLVFDRFLERLRFLVFMTGGLINLVSSPCGLCDFVIPYSVKKKWLYRCVPFLRRATLQDMWLSELIRR